MAINQSASAVSRISFCFPSFHGRGETVESELYAKTPHGRSHAGGEKFSLSPTGNLSTQLSSCSRWRGFAFSIILFPLY